MKELIHHYGLWVVFALVFLESIGLPLPGEAILVSAAIFAGTTQNISIALVLLFAVVGAIFGSVIGFSIGDRYGYPLLLRYGSYAGSLFPGKNQISFRDKRRNWPAEASVRLSGDCPLCEKPPFGGPTARRRENL